ncbi:MAG: hypothetical protein IKP46_07505 [Bacteroidales bacterium]|nr:hypothetical protein [Bacteroidales bacterium]
MKKSEFKAFAKSAKVYFSPDCRVRPLRTEASFMSPIGQGNTEPYEPVDDNDNWN